MNWIKFLLFEIMSNKIKNNYWFIYLFIISSFSIILFYLLYQNYLKINLPFYFKILLILLLLFNSISLLIFYINKENNYFYRLYSKVIFINLFLILLITLIIELIFGNWLEENRINQLNIIRDQTLYYNIGDLYETNNKKITYTRDRFGFRGKYDDISNIDIVSIGGSTTDQRYISDEFTFESILSSEFKINKNLNIQIINAGVDGQSTYGHIKNFDYWFNNIENFKTKYFLFFIGNNDFYINPNHSYDELEKSNSNNIFRKIRFAIKSKSIFYYFYRVVEGTINTNRIGLTHNLNKKDNLDFGNWTSTPILKNHKMIMQKRLDEYQLRIRILIKKVESFGSKAIFVTQSRRGLYDFKNDLIIGMPNVNDYDLSKYNGVDYYYMSRLINEITKNEAIISKSIFIDLDNELNFDITQDFYDTSHHSESGTSKIGKYLYFKLKDLFN